MELDIPSRSPLRRLPSERRQHKIASRSRETKSGSRDQSRRHGTQVKRTRVQKLQYNYDSEYQRVHRVFTEINNIPELQGSTPILDLEHSDMVTSTLAIEIPRINDIPLHVRVYQNDPALDGDQLATLKAELRGYVTLLYSHGVAYWVKPDGIYLAPAVPKRSRGDLAWSIFLGQLSKAEYWPEERRNALGLAAWEEKRDEELKNVDRIFALVEPQVAGAIEGLSLHTVEEGFGDHTFRSQH